MLNWTGHALVDVGVATLCVMSNKNDPALLTLEDLDRAADEMERYYFSGALMSYLTCVFMNSEYVQPGTGAKKDESRHRYAQHVLRAHRAVGDKGARGQVCVFSGKPATHLIHRGQMPLLTGEGVLNFFPGGVGGLAISGPYLTAIQALPLGGRRSEGKLLIAHSDSAALTLALVKKFVEDNRRLLGLAMSGSLPNHAGVDETLNREQGAWDPVKKQPKFPDAKAAFSLIASDLLRVQEQRNQDFDPDTIASLQVYWLSSSGQGPSLEIFSIPCSLMRFLRGVSGASTSGAWTRLVGRGWAPPETTAGQPPKRPKLLSPTLVGPGRSKNPVLNDLIGIYANETIDARRARSFVRRHLLSEARGKVERSDDCSWELTDLFLEEVLGMSPDRINRIREFADALGEYIYTRNDKPFFRAITFAKRPWELRNALVKAQRNEYSKGNSLLFTLADYLQVFEGEDSSGVADWSLVRDLISIRLVETLHQKQSLTPEMLAEESDTEKGE